MIEAWNPILGYFDRQLRKLLACLLDTWAGLFRKFERESVSSYQAESSLRPIDKRVEESIRMIGRIASWPPSYV